MSTTYIIDKFEEYLEIRKTDADAAFQFLKEIEKEILATDSYDYAALNHYFTAHYTFVFDRKRSEDFQIKTQKLIAKLLENDLLTKKEIGKLKSLKANNTLFAVNNLERFGSSDAYVEHLRQAVHYFSDQNESKGLVSAYVKIGVHFFEENNPTLALEEFIKGLNVFDENTPSNYLDILFNNVANCYAAIGKFDDAILYFNKALQKRIREKVSSFRIVSIHLNMALTYIQSKNFDKSWSHVKAIQEIINFPDSVLNNIRFQALLCFHLIRLKKYDEALEQFVSIPEKEILSINYTAYALYDLSAILIDENCTKEITRSFFEVSAYKNIESFLSYTLKSCEEDFVLRDEILHNLEKYFVSINDYKRQAKVLSLLLTTEKRKRSQLIEDNKKIVQYHLKNDELLSKIKNTNRLLELEKESNKKQKDLNKIIKDQKDTLEHQNKVLLSEIEQRAEIEKQLVQRNTELNDFTKIAYHDLKEPIRNLNGFIELIKKQFNNREDEQLKEYLEYMVFNANKMDRLSHRLIEFMEIENKHLSFDYISITAILESILKEEKYQKINYRTRFESIPQIYANEVLVEKLIREVLSNIISFSKEEIVLNCKWSESSWFYIFEFSDEGMGIAKEYIDKVFDFTFKANENTAENAGIGLSIARKIVQIHGGQIYMKSELNKGSTLTVLFPKV